MTLYIDEQTNLLQRTEHNGENRITFMTIIRHAFWQLDCIVFKECRLQDTTNRKLWIYSSQFLGYLQNKSSNK